MCFSLVLQNSSDYEYIIVGSGAGGGPLAARLALNGKKVLLIEAGDDQGENINQIVPVFHAYSTEDSSMSWDFYVKVGLISRGILFNSFNKIYSTTPMKTEQRRTVK
jgi:choline dehydrogenase-like flavoprotein